MQKTRFFTVLALLSLMIACNQQSKETGKTDAASATDEQSTPEVLKPGQTPPAFELVNLDGQRQTLETFKGKVVLLNFWATWCAPCVAEMPALQRLYAMFKDKGFEVVAVSADPASKQNDLKLFREKFGISFTILHDPLFGLPPRYGVTGFPETVLLNRDGQVVSFTDPKSGTTAPRVISDRPWDSQQYVDAIQKLL